MRDRNSMPFPFGLVLLACLPFLPRLIDASALQLSYELLSDDMAPT